VAADFKVSALRAAAYRVPTEGPEADGTAQWSATTLVTVHAQGGGQTGFGYSYGSDAMVPLIAEKLAPVVSKFDVFNVEAAYDAMGRVVRDEGHPGVAASAVSAVDVALWDLKARVLGLPLLSLLGRVRKAAPVYGSGGFTSYGIDQLQDQLSGWVEDGIRAVKMKVGAQPQHDVERVRAARRAVGDHVTLMVDANGAYPVKQALCFAAAFADAGGSWLEEPVSSDDLDGLRFVRDHAPHPIEVAAGEYGYDLLYFRRMLEARAVDVLQVDATRCGGITGFLSTARLCQAFFRPMSAHGAPSLHAVLGCAAVPLMHAEYFFDHARIESRLFDGFNAPRDGAIVPDLSRPGLGLTLKEGDAECHRVR
jgi:L-alanine-DL-glutamate epimerase-like enolase superfamily enzyme